MSIDESRLEFERAKWAVDVQLRERELALRETETSRSRWNNPLTIAVIAATIAGFANAGVTWLNSDLQRRLEDQRSTFALSLEERRSEAGRILEAIRIGSDPDKAATNLRFLIDAGLLSDETTRRVEGYLYDRKPGEGAALPTSTSSAPPQPRPQPSQFIQVTAPTNTWTCDQPLEPTPTARDVIDQISTSIRSSFEGTDLSIRQRNFADGEELNVDAYLPQHETRLTFRIVLARANKNIIVTLTSAAKSGGTTELAEDVVAEILRGFAPPGCTFSPS